MPQPGWTTSKRDIVVGIPTKHEAQKDEAGGDTGPLIIVTN